MTLSERSLKKGYAPEGTAMPEDDPRRVGGETMPGPAGRVRPDVARDRGRG